MPGILDVLDNPDLLSNLLGVSSANAATPSGQPQQPPPPPPQSVMSGAPPYSPSSAIGTMSGNDAVAQRFPQAGGMPPVNNALADAAGALRNTPTVAQPPVPMPRPRPPGADAAMQPGTDAPPLPPPTTVGPAPGAPPMPPPSAMADAPATTGSGGGLASAFGLPSQYEGLMRKHLLETLDPTRSAISQGLAGLGKGLTAVGAQRPGASGAAAFAAGAGGALEGGNAQENAQQNQQRQELNDMFNGTSKAFNDLVAAKKLGNEDILTQAHANYYNSLAAMRANGIGRNGAWQNTDYGKAANLETMLDKWENSQRLTLQAKWKQDALTGGTPDVAGDLANLQKQKEAERTRRATALGIHPDTHLSGVDKQHSFDYDTMSPQQYLQVPDGAWIKKKDPGNPKADKDGYVYQQRDWLSTPPHPGWEPTPGSPAQPIPPPYQAEMQ
jgi:hypothetical protein